MCYNYLIFSRLRRANQCGSAYIEGEIPQKFSRLRRANQCVLPCIEGEIVLKFSRLRRAYLYVPHLFVCIEGELSPKNFRLRRAYHSFSPYIDHYRRWDILTMFAPAAGLSTCFTLYRGCDYDFPIGCRLWGEGGRCTAPFSVISVDRSTSGHRG